jgi:hypothetical protein
MKDMSIYINRYCGFFLTLFILGILIFYIIRFKDKRFNLRKIPALDALDEAIGRATELGRPVHMCTGLGRLQDQYAQQTIAGLSILGYVARLTARLGVPLIFSCAMGEVIPPAEGIIREAYISEGKEYDPNIIRYLGDEQRALMAAGMGVISRERVGANILTGAYFWEAIVLAEHGASVGAMQIGGTARQSQLPILAAACDYTLIGEELLVAGVYLSKDNRQIASLAGMDIIKIVSIILMIISVIAAAVGSSTVYNFLGL